MIISAIILAGGKSTRMNYNKEYIKENNEYLVHKQIKQLSKLFKEIIVVSDNSSHYKDYPVKVVSDELKGNSPIIGLHAGLKASSNDYNFIIACDMPNISKKFINFLKKQIINKDCYVVKINRYIEPFQSIFSKRIVPIIKKLVEKKEFGFQNMVKQLDTYYIYEKEIISYLNEIDLFKNINNESDLFNIHKENLREYKIMKTIKITEGSKFNKKDKIIKEYQLNIYINDNYFGIVMTTPSNLEFLLTGFLYSNFLIDDISEIVNISFDIEKHTVNSILVNKLSNKIRKKRKYYLNDDYKFNLDEILEKVNSFNKESNLFKQTGAVHSSKLICEDIEFLIEDISRHNTFDKIIGYILKNNLIDKKKYIITSGRISSNILLKCARSNIPLIISRGAPTDLSINQATESNICVMGFARGTNVNVYCHNERIIMEEFHENQ